VAGAAAKPADPPGGPAGRGWSQPQGDCAEAQPGRAHPWRYARRQPLRWAGKIAARSGCPGSGFTRVLARVTFLPSCSFWWSAR